MLKHCTFCKHYNIHAVYFPELYGLPLSTICVKLQWPRMYEQGELEDIEAWGFMKDCDLYERYDNLAPDESEACDQWEKSHDNSRGSESSRPRHSNKIEQAQGCNDQEQRSGRINDKASTEGEGAFMATGHGTAQATKGGAITVKGVHRSVEKDQLRLPCGETNS